MVTRGEAQHGPIPWKEALPPTAAQPLVAMDSEKESVLGWGMSPMVSGSPFEIRQM
jgi:hypothetical protein